MCVVSIFVNLIHKGKRIIDVSFIIDDSFREGCLESWDKFFSHSRRVVFVRVCRAYEWLMQVNCSYDFYSMLCYSFRKNLLTSGYTIFTVYLFALGVKNMILAGSTTRVAATYKLPC